MRYLEARDLGTLLAALARTYDLYAPEQVEGAFVLRRIAAGEPTTRIAWNPYRLADTYKPFWFQPARRLMRWTDAGPQDEAESRPRALVGMKACDLRALAVLDRVFHDHDFREPAYVRAREVNLIVSGDCTDHGPSCFCTMLGGGPHPEDHFDLNLSPSDGGFIVTIGSPKGDAVIRENGALFTDVSPERVDARDARRAELHARVEALNGRFPVRDPFERSVDKHAHSRLWGELAATCVECSACNLVCPTCHCFLLSDVRHDAGAVRTSLWDSCFHAGYARMAGGGTPRLQLTERFRNHYFHKFVAFPRNWGITACSGCGRCIDACMGAIDKRDCLHRLETRWIPSEMVGDRD